MATKIIIDKEQLLETWINIGKANPWIRQVGSGDPNDDCAFEKPFGKDYFHECATIDILIGYFMHGNWCLGQAFYYKNLCFINQINAGDEWLTIRDDIDFESITAILIIEHDGKDGFKEWIARVLRAPKDKLRTFDY